MSALGTARSMQGVPMGKHHRLNLALAGIDKDQLGEAGLGSIIREMLSAKLHGVAFSPYVDGQDNETEVGPTRSAPAWRCWRRIPNGSAPSPARAAMS